MVVDNSRVVDSSNDMISHDQTVTPSDTLGLGLWDDMTRLMCSCQVDIEVVIAAYDDKSGAESHVTWLSVYVLHLLPTSFR